MEDCLFGVVILDVFAMENAGDEGCLVLVGRGQMGSGGEGKDLRVGILGWGLRRVGGRM